MPNEEAEKQEGVTLTRERAAEIREMLKEYDRMYGRLASLLDIPNEQVRLRSEVIHNAVLDLYGEEIPF